MNDYKFVKDYRDNSTLRKSFFALAKATFDIDFAPWYHSGAWQDDYICYSFKHNNRIVSNVSIHKMTIIQEDKEYSAIQIGTVMTDKNYQNQGLAKQLLQKVIQEYQAKVELIFLFANNTVLDFYPQFDFYPVIEYSYLEELSSQPAPTKVNSIEPIQDFSHIHTIASSRIPVSQKLGVVANPGLIHFYTQLVFPNNSFLIPELQTIVLYEIEENTLHLYDIISTYPIKIDTVLPYILTSSVKKIRYHFMPDDDSKNLEITPILHPEDSLFIYGESPLKENGLLFPTTSHG